MTDESLAASLPEKTDVLARTPDMIAAEIVVIKEQSKKILLVSAVEIGRRLREAKEIVPYGEFGAWLKEAVQYSERMAYKLMQLAEEFEPYLAANPDSAPGEELKANPYAALSYSQALILLGLPKEDRAEFIAEFDLESMAVRELEQVVQERKKILAENSALLKENEAKKKTISKLWDDLDKAAQDVQRRKQDLWAVKSNAATLKHRIKVLENESAAARHITEVEHKHEIAKLKLSMAQADARFDLIAKGLEDLLVAIKEMAAADPAAFQLFIDQTNQLLSNTSRKLRRIEIEGINYRASD